ncbi:hypothetical protein BJ165DRAFT_1521722 [Panaeolus papilionaceus]|nr:hypothetical protein BJ165DRAFT_1521722 [Panaeolus papilionaceus]
MQYSVLNFVCLAIALSSSLSLNASARPVAANAKQSAQTASASSSAAAHASSASASASSSSSSSGSASKTVGAAYVITNDPSGNQIVAMNIGSDGLLSSVNTIDAGGRGAHGQSSPIGPDPLFSQGAIKVNAKNSMLVTVNSASNTAVMFNIDPNNPSNLTMVGTPVSAGGDFPVSLAINKDGSMACVLNGGAINGVNCYKTDKTLGLIAMPNTLRSLGLNQTTPATGPAGTASHVIFNADESQLIASVKGVPPTPGFLASWAISSDGSLSAEPVKSTPKDGLLPFGMALVPNSNAVVVADAGVGLDVFDFGGAVGGKGGKGKGKGKHNKKGDKKDNKKDKGKDKSKDNADSKDQSNNGASSSSNSNSTISSNSSSNSTSSADANANANSNSNSKAHLSRIAGSASNSSLHRRHSSSSSNSSSSSSSSPNSDSVSQQASSTTTTISGQAAVCWTAFSPASGNFYLSDIGTALITEVNVDKQLNAKVVKQYQQPQGSAPIDLEVGSVGSNDFLYILTANATSINVLNVNQPGNAKQVQEFNFGSALKSGDNSALALNLQGMATFIKQ